MRGVRLYELWTGLYMLDPWEKIAFSKFLRINFERRGKLIKLITQCRFDHPNNVWGRRLCWAKAINWGVDVKTESS